MNMPRIPNRTSATGPLRMAAALLVAGTLLGGCSLLGGSREPVTIYAPDPRIPADPAWPQATWQLSISRPDAARMIDSARIVVRPTPGELQVYKGAAWGRTPGEQLQDIVLRTLEDSRRIDAVARQGSGIAADYKLEMDLRRFEADYAGNAVPAATIEVNAKLLHNIDQDVVASRTFLQAVPATGTDTALVAQAFGQALAAIGHDIAGWTLDSGNAHEGSGAHAGRD
jgi:cholesterol transport system auxiliary component